VLREVLRDAVGRQRDEVPRLDRQLGGAPVQSLAEIGRDLGITRERARQIQEEAMKKLRKLSQDE
jgi:RNA polymerase nonessential primary-like sigma factor